MTIRTLSCDLTNVTAEQCTRHAWVSNQLLAARTDVQREGNTWRVFFEGGVSLALIAEFLEFERRCCSFLDFDLCGRASKVCVELTGPEGAADLIATLFPLTGV